MGLWPVGVGNVRLYPVWYLGARSRGLHESSVWEGVDEGDGEGEVEDGSRHMVNSCRYVLKPCVFFGTCVESKHASKCIHQSEVILYSSPQSH